MKSCKRLQELVENAALADTSMALYPVTDQVVLAGQPEPDDWRRLAEDGFELVINVRSDPERAAQQAESARAAGLDYVHLNVPAYELETPHLQQFQETLAGANGGRVLLHCRTASRVALMWMLNRITNEGWSQEQAEAELAEAGYLEDDMEVFRFCTEDYMEREAPTEFAL